MGERIRTRVREKGKRVKRREGGQNVLKSPVNYVRQGSVGDCSFLWAVSCGPLDVGLSTCYHIVTVFSAIVLDIVFTLAAGAEVYTSAEKARWFDENRCL